MAVVRNFRTTAFPSNSPLRKLQIPFLFLTTIIT